MRFPLASLLLRGPDRQQERPELDSPLCDPSGHFGHPKKGNVLRYFLGGAMWGVEGAASFSFRGEFPGHFLPLSQAKNSANKSLLHTVKRKPPAVHLYSQATASPLCVISEAVRKP